ncbi:thymidine phosphorylase family protein [Hyphococcus luteus]|uniref:Putative thymidine phosphorylase n=1 Tax=Hyphococcus luteus TaxID=2058213 RepID=A0A2S7K3Z7_9PROT|nr:thymidine phosphorylase family protein [Marinicaulis flavus]PQA87206.1 thymidine phosphorylase [Marinicaulis flavus]
MPAPDGHLKIKRVAIDTEPENTVFLSRQCAVYRPEEFRALKKIEVTSGGKSLLATLSITDDHAITAPDELGLGVQAFRRLGAPEGAAVEIEQATPPRSLDAVRRKIAGEVMSPDEIKAIINDIAAHRYSPMEIAAYLIAAASFTTTDEVLAMTRAMAASGAQIDWDAPLVVDKHCIGGIPGNRTSMIVAPIVAAHGLTMPKTSSRAITSPSGTADTMEVLANVALSIDEMKDVVEREHACLAWGGHVNLSPADDVLITVERPLSIDTREQMVASILSKKLAAGSTHIVLDIPMGPTAKVRSQSEAVRLRKLMEYVSAEIGLVIDVVFTDGAQPVGRGIGPVLEARDVMAVLNNEAHAPADLRARALLLAGRVLDFDPDLRGGMGRKRAQELLDSGKALAAMERIIDAQGRADKPACAGELTAEIIATHEGVVAAMDCFRIARIARLAGAPMDKGAGIDLFKKMGDPVKKGDALYRIHSCFSSDFEFAKAMAHEHSGVTVDGAPVRKSVHT